MGSAFVSVLFAFYIRLATHSFSRGWGICFSFSSFKVDVFAACTAAHGVLLVHLVALSSDASF